MVATNLSAFIQEVIERVGRQPNLIKGNTYVWKHGEVEIVLEFGSKNADIEVNLIVNPDAIEEHDTYRHTYELTDSEAWNGSSGGTLDSTMYTYDRLVDVVGGMVAAEFNLAA